jgi:hypothetical protein
LEGKAMSVERPEGLIEDAGQRGEPRRLDQMISVRLDPLLVAALRKHAEACGVSLSDVLREAALQLLAREEAKNVRTFCVEVTNETRPEARREAYRQEVPLAVLRSLQSVVEPGLGARVFRPPDLAHQRVTPYVETARSAYGLATSRLKFLVASTASRRVNRRAAPDDEDGFAVVSELHGCLNGEPRRMDCFGLAR